MSETVQGRLSEAQLREAERVAAPVVRVGGYAGTERRRPGRQPDVSPELIALMREPTASARVRVALYDAPGFLLPQGRAPRSRRDDAFMFRAVGIAVGLMVASAALVGGMCWVWS